MKDEIRDITIPIRVTFSEKENIMKNAKKVNRPLSTYMRQLALGYDMREKPDRRLIIELIKSMRDVTIVINNFGREQHILGFVNDKNLERQKEELTRLIARVKKELL